MSDAFSDIAQDKRIGEFLEEILKKEQGLKQSISPKEDVLDIIQDLKNYMNLRRGFNISPDRGFTFYKIGVYSEFLDGNLTIDELLPNIHLAENDAKFYTAVGGHGMFMGGDIEGVVRKALETNYGSEIHAFKLHIDKNGSINPIKIDCGECSEVAGLYGCSLIKRCNCYDETKYQQQSALMKKGKEYLGISGFKQ